MLSCCCLHTNIFKCIFSLFVRTKFCLSPTLLCLATWGAATDWQFQSCKESSSLSTSRAPQASRLVSLQITLQKRLLVKPKVSSQPGVLKLITFIDGCPGKQVFPSSNCVLRVLLVVHVVETNFPSPIYWESCLSRLHASKSQIKVRSSS